MTKRAATLGELQELHRLIAKSLNQRIEQDIEDNIPTDAATLGAAIKFLKDNSVTADPADADDLGALRDKLAKQAKERRERGSNVVALASADLQQMEA
jgi:molybdopterin converting factor small subunit